MRFPPTPANRPVFGLLLLLAALSSAEDEIPARSLRVEEVLPHDPSAFTQCLMADPAGGAALLEGTGLYGASELRRVRPATGEPIRRVALPDELFGEGCALAGGALVQLTWREGTILLRDPVTLAERSRLPWPREGWGAAGFGDTLWISDGSDTLHKVLLPSGRELGKLAVRAGGRAVARLNELAEAGRFLVANVWRSDSLAVIDRATGRVVEWWNAAPLRAAVPKERRGRMEVLNGVADAGDGSWYLTGKYWPALYRAVPEGSALSKRRK